MTECAKRSLKIWCSFYEAPHASLVTEADVTEVMQLIAREKERFFADAWSETHHFKFFDPGSSQSDSRIPGCSMLHWTAKQLSLSVM